MEQLPDDVLHRIFSKLTYLDLLSLAAVNRKFDFICSTYFSWEPMFRERWPRTWNVFRKISHQNPLTLINWRRETAAAKTITKTLHKKLNTLSLESFDYKHVPSTALDNIFTLLRIGINAKHHLFNELLTIVEERNVDLTLQYYAYQVLIQVHMFLNEDDFKEYFQMPPAIRSLEKSAFLFAKWFQAKERYTIEYEKIRIKFNKLAYAVQSYMKNINPQNPAAHSKLVSPLTYLDISSWDKTHCEEIICAVLYVLQVQYKFRVSEQLTPRNFWLNVVLETKAGSLEVICVIYAAVCHRLGIHLQPFKRALQTSNQLCLGWRAPDSISDAFLFYTGMGFEKISNDETPFFPSSSAQILKEMTEKLLMLGYDDKSSLFSHYDVIIPAASLTLIFHFHNPYDDFKFRFLYEICISYEIFLERILQSIEILININFRQNFNYVSKTAEALLSIQKSYRRQAIPKFRYKKLNILFAAGMIMRHKITNCPRVIIGWDEICDKSKKWDVCQVFPFLKFKQLNQPFYKVLTSDNSVSYDAEEHIFPSLNYPPLEINNSELGKYFKGIDGVFYVPNDELASEYPSDENCRRFWGESVQNM